MSGLNASIDLYDHDRITINRVCAAITAAVGTNQPVDAFDREIRERFHEAGFVVDIIWAEETDEVLGSKRYIPNITIMDRVEPEDEFDHERMRHEVKSDLLGLRGGDNRQQIQVTPGFASTKSGLIVPKGSKPQE